MFFVDDCTLKPFLVSVQGFIEFTYLFIGFYNHTVVEDSNFSYNIPLAYLLTVIFYFVLWIISIVARSVPDSSQVYFQYAHVFSHLSD